MKKVTAKKSAAKKTRIHNRHHLDRHAAVLRDDPQAAGDDDGLLTAEEVAKWLRVSEAWIVIGRNQNYGPRYVKLAGQVIRYKRSDVRAWLDERVFANTTQYKAKQARDRKLSRSAAEA